MRVQVIQDSKGKAAGVFIPMSDWEIITQQHQDLKQLTSDKKIEKKKLSELAGSLSKETAEALQKHVEESRNESNNRIE